MNEEKFKPVDHLNKKYNELIESMEIEQSPAEFFDSLNDRDSMICRIMTWYYKVFEAGYHALASMGFSHPDQIAKLQADLSAFSVRFDWPEIKLASDKIPEIMEHISKRPEKEDTDEHDEWIDKLNDLNDECTDMFMDSDVLFYERMFDFYNNYA